MCFTAATSVRLTSVSFFSLRMRPCALVPVKWRLPECARTILPVAVNLKRLAAPRCVFSFLFGLLEFLGIAAISPLVLTKAIALAARAAANLVLPRARPSWGEQRHQDCAFHSRHRLDLTVLADLPQQTCHLGAAHFLVRHLASAMKNHGAHLVPFPEESNDLILANLIIVLRSRRPKLYFLELRAAAALALLMRLLILLVNKFAVVGDLADRRSPPRPDSHQRQSPRARQTNSRRRPHHTQLPI